MSRHKAAPTITADALRKVLKYSPSTGKFIWIANNGKMRAGAEAGNRMKPTGYIQICINYKNYRAHRLAWLYMYGEWPNGHLDHKNRITSDNRIKNLRLATISENGANSKARKSITGFKGVDFINGKFRARFRSKSTGRIHLGMFNTAQEAHEAYKRKALTVFGEFAHTTPNWGLTLPQNGCLSKPSTAQKRNLLCLRRKQPR